MMLFHRNVDHEDTLYEKTQKVHYCVSSAAREEKELPLNVRVSLATTRRSGLTEERVLRVTLTDDTNPLLLYVAEVDAELYAKLRHKLGLLIDFTQFPNQLVNLLAQCGETTAAPPPPPPDHEGVRYALALEEVKTEPYEMSGGGAAAGGGGGGGGGGSCILFKIVEVNRFQRLCVIALQVTAGSETEINALMARNATLLKRRIAYLETRAKESEERAFRAEEQTKAKAHETDRLREQLRQQTLDSRAKADEQADALRREHATLQREHERRLAQAVREHEETRKAESASLAQTLERCRAEVASLRQANRTLETETRERDQRLEKFHGDVKILQDEILKLEGKVSCAESAAKERNAFVAGLRQRYAHLERERDDKEKAAKRLAALLEAADSGKSCLRTALKERADEYEKQRRELSEVAADLAKANEIIGKLGKEQANAKRKLSERAKLALEQQKAMEGLSDAKEKAESVAREQCARLEELRRENAELRETLRRAQSEVQLKEEAIKKNERIIGWLNDIVSKQESGSKARSSVSGSKCSSVVSSSVDSVISKTNSMDKKYLQSGSENELARANNAYGRKLCKTTKPMIVANKK